MKKIESFKVNHDTLVPGLYVSRVDGNAVTYDIRMRKPNCGSYLENATMHTLEHILATLARNSDIADSVIYVGPMGCRTGFYLIVNNSVPESVVLYHVCDWFFYLATNVKDFERDGIPGATKAECGNYLEHDLVGAYEEACKMYCVLKNWRVAKMKYPD